MSRNLTVKEAAVILGRSVKTLQRWDREGVLVPTRTPTNRRVYAEEDVWAFAGRAKATALRVPLAYCRVSSAAQKPDLANQVSVVESFCAARGIPGVEVITEVGGGMNFKRPGLRAVFDRVERGEVSHLVIAHKDRLARFGFEWFAYTCQRHQTELLVLNQTQTSPEAEMVEDLMTIIHCFSSRLYGLRNYKKSLKDALK